MLRTFRTISKLKMVSKYSCAKVIKATRDQSYFHAVENSIGIVRASKPGVGSASIAFVSVDLRCVLVGLAPLIVASIPAMATPDSSVVDT